MSNKKSNDDLIKDASYSINIELMKNEFIKQYATKKGWDFDNLDKEQLNEIQSLNEYKSLIVKS